MPSHKQIVKRSAIEVAKRRRTCKFSGNSIEKGEVCLIVYDGPRKRSSYCRDVGIEMIRTARLRLDELDRTLHGNAAN